MTKINKTNKEIIIEELEEADRNVDIKEKHGMFIINTENFATTLLSKLNIPEEGEVALEGMVDDVCRQFGKWACYKNSNDKYRVIIKEIR